MSTYEYNDLYLNCQDTGIYHMFIFDIKNSKQMTFKQRQDAQIKMEKLMLLIYQEIEQIQNKENKRILVFEEDFVTYQSHKPYKGFGFKQEPFLFADTFGFTIYRDSLDKDIIYDIFYQYKKLLNIDFELHISNGYYETNNYLEGNTKYFRGYCIDILSTTHKPETKKELKKVKKK